MSPDKAYDLGHDKAELERLDLQGRMLGPASRTLLLAAGLRPGMRVLDLGSGGGDLAFVAAELVGPGGEVVGVERAPDAVAHGNARAHERGLSNIRVVQGDIHDPAPDGPYDALIGRLVLLYAPDPAAVLKAQFGVLRRGAVVAPIECDAYTSGSVPATPLVTQASSWSTGAFEQAGIPPALGPQLWSVLVQAGLRPLGMLAVQPHFGPDDPDGPAWLAGVVRSLLPLIERTQLATADEIDIDTLPQRIAVELASAGAVFAYPTLFSAWANAE
jgi:ubiquinone/menaquinone biosynthesis C-methylase UbiE